MNPLRLPGVAFALALSGLSASAQTIVTPPQSQVALNGSSATFNVTASGTAPLGYQWQRNGTALAGATTSSLSLPNAQPDTTGIYTVKVTSGTASTSASAPLGLSLAPSTKFVGSGTEVLSNQFVASANNTFDQILLQGSAVTVTADPSQVTRISYVDLSDDIVQVEFSGAGTLSLVLDNPTGPATAVNYNQPSVSYMRGHAGLVIAGANESTNVSVFSVGTGTAVNQALFNSNINYDGIADIAYIAILSANGKFGGLRTANTSYFATTGFTGVYAPGVQFTGPVYVGNINAFDSATPVLLLGSAPNVQINGGDLLQSNAQPVLVSGFTALNFVDGSTSHNTLLPAQTNSGRLVQNGTDVTSAVTVNAGPPTLYVAYLRPETGAVNSTSSGIATILLTASGALASVNVSFSNLSSSEVSGHLRISPGGDFVYNLPPGQVTGALWSFTPKGNYTTADLVNALKSGNIFVGIDSVNYPSGEVRGSFVQATGSQTFTAPDAPPAIDLTHATAADASRLLTQATFGPKKSEIDALTNNSLDAWITAQLALPFSSHLDATTADFNAFGGNNGAPFPPNRQAAWFKHALTAPDQLRQRVAFALSELFVVSDEALGQQFTYGLANYYDLLGAGAFGNFRTLLENVTLSPIMGNYLSSLRAAKADPVAGTYPDENYAREVMQLFTIGLNQLQPDGTLKLDANGLPIPTYDQATITEMAKVFTGLGYPSTNLAAFRTARPDYLTPMQLFPAYHDDTVKSIVNGVVIPANQGGTKDLQLALDALFNHPNTAPFIARHFIQRLVTSNPSPAYVYRVAQKFVDDGTGVRGNLAAVVRAVLVDYEARSPAVAANAGFGKLKEPLLRLTNLMRSFSTTAQNGRYLGSGTGTNVTATENNLAQASLRAPTVFNFFHPSYVLPGALATAGLVAPEFEITDDNFAITVPNFLRNFVIALATGASASAVLVPNHTYEQTLLPTPSALLDHLALLLADGTLTTATRTRITTALAALPANTTTLDRTQTAILLVATSPDAATQK